MVLSNKSRAPAKKKTGPKIDWSGIRDEEIDEDELLRDLCKESFYDFVKEFWSVISKEKPVWNWHIRYICKLAQRAVENLIAGNDKLWDMLVNVPPGTSKSTILSVMLPAWVWTRMPECQFICVSFRYPLALELSRRCRDVVKSDKYRRLFPEIKIRKDQDSKHHFILEGGGYRYCAGSGGDIIGRHAHVICLPWETMVESSVGELPIGKIVDEKLPVEVLAFDHTTGKTVWRAIEKYEVSEGRPLCRVEFSDGCELELTEDHPIFVRGRGYVQPKDLVPGDVVYDLRSRREKASEKDSLRPGAVRRVQKDVHADHQKGPNLPERERVLHAPVRPHRKADHQAPVLSVVCGPDGTPEDAEVLLERVQRTSASRSEAPEVGRTNRVPVFVMRETPDYDERGRQTEEKSLLFSGLCEPSAFPAPKWEGERQLRPRKKSPALRHRVQGDSQKGPQAGRVSLLPVSKDQKRERRAADEYSPRRLRHDEQCRGKSGLTLPVVSRPDAPKVDQQAGEVGWKVVSAVKSGVRLPGKVYNLRVAQDHNYFAEGILVHNCIDDPIDPKGTASEAELEAVNLWIEEELSSRKVDKDRSITILVMQRLHMGDPTARMLQYATRLKHVKLPAVLEWEGQPLGTVPAWAENRYKDGLLDPVRLTRKTLEEVAKKPRGKYLVSAQYLQEPCLVAGTLVATARGAVPIEQVTIEDQVYTRDGLKRVLWSGKTGEVDTIVSVLFANGAVISGTPEHPVFTKNRGWVRLDSMRRGDYTVVGQFPQSEKESWAGRKGRTAKSYGSTASSTSAPPAKRISQTESRAGIDCTGTCGGSTTETFPLAMTSTTRTETRETTTSAILSACPSGTTASATARRELIETFLIESDTWVTPGTSPKPGGSSTATTGGKSSRNGGEMLSTTTVSARSAERCISHGPRTSSTSIVRTGATKQSGCGSTTGSARSVRTSSSPPSGGPSVVLDGVRTSGGGGKSSVPVYDLTVEGNPEFFANGILVHNCPPGGGMFQTKKIVTLTHQESLMYTDPRLARKNLVRVCRFWDKAITEGGGAYTVGVKMGLTRSGRIVILDVQRFQHDSWRRERKILSTAKGDGRGVIVGLETEPGSGGKESTQATWRRLVGFHVKAIKPTQSKSGETRADAFSQQVNAGNVYLVPNPAWNETYLEELRHFPHSTYKDQVDASSGAFTVVWVNKRHVGALRDATPVKEVKPNGRPRTLVRGLNKHLKDRRGRLLTV